MALVPDGQDGAVQPSNTHVGLSFAQVGVDVSVPTHGKPRFGEHCPVSVLYVQSGLAWQVAVLVLSLTAHVDVQPPPQLHAVLDA